MGLEGSSDLQIVFFVDLEVVASVFVGLALGAVGCASWAGRVAIGIERKCPRPVTTL